MRVIVFSDVHANLPALETMIAETRETADRYICLGDVVNYGPWNDECLERVCDLPGIIYLQGNHERLFLGLDAIAHENPLVQDFYAYSMRSFTRRALIENLPLTTEVGPFLCTHTIADLRIFPDTPLTLARDTFIGHTHYLFAREIDGRRLVNCGSVGQNRKTLRTLAYAVYDTVSDTVSLCEIPYAYELVLQEMRAQNYPAPCIDYYLKKAGLL